MNESSDREAPKAASEREQVNHEIRALPREYEVLERLYDSEINAKVEWQWDAGYEVALLKGYANDEVIDVFYSRSYPAVMYALAKGACERFPSSEFRKWWGAL